ncbi:MAG TPA: class I SAM-dependent methyltransferase [Anaerolineae bacterium]|nr:class I SAM-dependent methyltransferase [Anaerolineae bacterium]
MHEKAMVRSGYDAIAGEYWTTRSEDSEDVLLLREIADRLPEGARVLDAGCGAGVPVAQMLSRRFKAVGVDFSTEQLHLASRLVPDLQLVCQDLTHLGFRSNSLDAICSYYAIIHIPRREHEAMLRDFYRILKPSGLALLCLGANDLEDDRQDYHGVRMYWSHFDAETNLRLLRDCGFEIHWSRLVEDSTSPGSEHLFVLAQKDRAGD